MNSLELFAGIGGQALALSATNCKPAAYCEIDPWAQKVLLSNMKQGRLHKAPIIADVTKLTSKDVKKIHVISGGFPCQGLSGLGKGLGLYGDERSNLVKHIYRLVDELKPMHVFLENVPLIMKDVNFKKFIHEFTRRGFKCSFMCLSASQVGAKHRRRRWFFLASKPNATAFTINTRKERALKSNFSQVVEKKLIKKKLYEPVRTCRAFGNSVVPIQALTALKILAQALKEKVSITKFVDNGAQRPWVVNGDEYAEWDEYEPLDMKCDGDGFHIIPPTKNNRRLSREQVKKPYKTQCMPTATTNPHCCKPSRTISGRSRTEAGTVLVHSPEMYASKMPPFEERLKLSISPEFWAMSFGFNKNWISDALVECHKDRIIKASFL